MSETEFPVDWNEWNKEWQRWKRAHRADLRATRERFEGKNLLADDVLGTWDINGRTVELSEVTFPDFGSRDSSRRFRAVGITYGTGVDGAGTVVHSWRELERALGIPGRHG